MDEAIPRSVETVVIGAGHSGLITSWYLRQAGREHVVLERRETLGGGWQDRWDGFRLVTPNWITALPGYPYDGPDPDGFMDRESLVARIAGYAAAIDAPVRLAIEVTAVEANPAAGRRFRLTTSDGPITADHVIVASGSFQAPRVPGASAGFSRRITQLHSHDYRNDAQLPPGGVLLIGSGQTGAQLAEELHEAGREVFLSVGQCGRVPRRYRGRDCFAWLRALAESGDALGAGLPTVGQLPDPRMRFAGNPHVSGHRGGHDTNLRQMAADGIRLVGRFVAADGEHATFAPDLSANLQFADGFFDARFRPIIDTFIERSTLDAPADDRAWPAFEPPAVTELDLDRAGISTVLWTSGYARDYGWLRFPILDDAGLPRNERGVSEVPGLTFIGLLWQHTIASANLVGVDLDAAYLASHWQAT